ncbi:MAG: PD-(D/E)XK nuclease family protein [Thermodesulfobacteriota bacterium]
MSYSISRLILYGRCPWAYKEIYLNKTPQEENEYRETGLELHQKVQPYLVRLIRKNLQSDWIWAAAQESSLKDVAEVWRRFYRGFSLPAGLQDPGVERRLAFTRNWEPCGYFAPEAFFRMVLDFHFRQHAQAVIMDWKSGWKMMDTVEDDPQLLTYGWGLWRAVYPDAKKFQLKLYFLRYGQSRKITLTPEQLQSVPRKLEEKIAQIEGDQKFEPRPGSFCGMCGVAAHCPHVARSLVPRELIAPSTLEEVQKAAEQLLALRVMSKTITARLKNWAAINGSISVRDQVFGPSFIDTLDTKQVVQTLLDDGMDREAIWPLLSVSKTALKSTLKKLKQSELLNQVMTLTSGEPETRFDFRKAEKAISNLENGQKQKAA